MACWTCSDSSYANCEANGANHYCQDEQFHCALEEEKHRGNVVRVEMGCKQDLACRRGWLQNSNGVNLGGVDIAGYNSATRDVRRIGTFGNTNQQNNQCHHASTTQVTSVCRQCCKSAGCSDAFKDGSTTDFDATGDHESENLVIHHSVPSIFYPREILFSEKPLNRKYMS